MEKEFDFSKPVETTKEDVEFALSERVLENVLSKEESERIQKQGANAYAIFGYGAKILFINPKICLLLQVNRRKFGRQNLLRGN